MKKALQNRRPQFLTSRIEVKTGNDCETVIKLSLVWAC